jgi:hypothetical protein
MSHHQHWHHLASGAAVVAISALSLSGPRTLASSHCDAPLIKQDPQANLTDVYAFMGARYDDPGETVLNVIANVRPFCEPGDGPAYDRFAGDARYSLHVTDPATGETKLRYDFTFSAVTGGLKNSDTILSYGLGSEVGPILNVGDGRQNYTQTYAVTRVMGEASTPLASGLQVPPANAGGNVTPAYNDGDGKAISGAATFAELDVYTQQSVYDLATGETVFAGSRDDSFYADVPGIFNLLDVRILDNNGTLKDGLGQDGDGVDGFKGFNVLTFAVQIPLEVLEVAGAPGTYESVFFGEQTGVGAYATIQVSRLGNPLFNETLVPLRDKDRYNRAAPATDSSLAVHAANPELATLINVVFGTAFAETDRADLVNIFIPDVLRVNTTTGPVRLDGAEGFSRLGFLGGDTTAGVSSGWPNGRRFGDDVVDIAVIALLSDLRDPANLKINDPFRGNYDGVIGNELGFNKVFPYESTPQNGRKIVGFVQ